MINSQNVEDLKTKGFTYLEPIEKLQRDEILKLISNSCSDNTYYGDFQDGEKIANMLQLSKIELEKLHESIFFEKVKEKNFYSVLRIVKDGQSSEALRMHFDSHRFTVVVPIEIPNGEYKFSGELITFPKIRKEPKNILLNILGKVYTKIFSIRFFFYFLLKIKLYEISDFKDHRPILFLGRQTLHGNYLLKMKPFQTRTTLLLHYFDPDGEKGIGGIMRSLRKRLTR